MAYPLLVTLVLVGCVTGQDPRPISYSVREDQGKGTMLGNVFNDAQLYTSYNSTVQSELQWSILEDSTGWHQYFVVSNQGLFRTDKSIDREVLCPSQDLCNANMDIQILPYQYFRIVKVSVQVMDVNDNPPRFAQSSLKLSLSESSTIGTSLGIPAAEDLDSPRFGVQKYELSPRTSTFDVSYTLEDDEEEVYIVLREKLDRESKEVYSLQLVATDGGTPPNTAVAAVEIEILDINDNSPKFSQDTYAVTVTENVDVGSAIITMRAEDPDQGSHIKYAFSSRTAQAYGDVFAIDEDAGTITNKVVIDYETEASYTLNVVARDESLLSLSAQASVVISVRDLNDNAPSIHVTIFTGNATHVMLEEGGDAGIAVAHVKVTDPDSGNGGKLNCFLSNNKFLLSQLSDTHYKIVSSTVLDREESSRYDVMIRCDDRGNPPRSANTTIIVVVTDVNDNAPEFSQGLYRASMLLNSPAGTHVVNVQATDKDQGLSGTVSYSVVSPMDQVFRINISSGDIALKTPADFGGKKWMNLTVKASDHGMPGKTSQAHVVIDLVASVDVIPEFAQVLYSFSVAENTPVRTEVGKVSLLSSQHGLDIKYLYRVKAQPPENMFTIDQYTGKIFTAAVPDREGRESYDLVLSAGVGGESRVSLTEVTIFIEDENDNAPVLVFPRTGRDIVEVSNQIPVGQQITQIEATDEDKARNKLLTYMILSGNEKGYFATNKDTGSFFLRKELKHVDTEIFDIGIIVQDEGRPSLSTEGHLKVRVDSAISPPLGVGGEGGGTLNSTTYMIIGIVGGVVLILIVVIVLVVIRWQKKNAKKYKDIENKMKKMEDSNNNADFASTSGNMSRDSDGDSRPSRNSFATFDDPKFRFPQINPPPDSDSGCSTDIPNTESSRGSVGSNNNLNAGYRGHVIPYGPGSLWQTQIPEDGLYQENQHSNPHLNSSQEENGGIGGNGGFGGLRNPRGRPRYGVNPHPDPQRGYSSGEEMSRYTNNRPTSSMSYDGANPSARAPAQDYHRPYHSDGSRSSTPQEIGQAQVYGAGGHGGGQRRRSGGSTARRNLMHNRPALHKTESWSSDSSAVSGQPPLVTNQLQRLHKSHGDMLSAQHHSSEPDRAVRSADWTPQRPTPRYPDTRDNSYYPPGGYSSPHSASTEPYALQNQGYYHDNNNRQPTAPHHHQSSSRQPSYSEPQFSQQQYPAPSHNQAGNYGNNQYSRQSAEPRNDNYRNAAPGYPPSGVQQGPGHGDRGQNLGGGGYRQEPSVSHRSALRGYLNLADDDVIQELEVTV